MHGVTVPFFAAITADGMAATIRALRRCRYKKQRRFVLAGKDGDGALVGRRADGGVERCLSSRNWRAVFVAGDNVASHSSAGLMPRRRRSLTLLPDVHVVP
jgi:chromosome condensin MukBEF ATPase and DNA-binding subunit MukB